MAPSPITVLSNPIECFLPHIACCIDQIGQSCFETSRFHMLRNLSVRRRTTCNHGGKIKAFLGFLGAKLFSKGDVPSLDRFDFFGAISSCPDCEACRARLDYCSGLDAKFAQDRGASVCLLEKAGLSHCCTQKRGRQSLDSRGILARRLAGWSNRNTRAIESTKRR